MTNKHKNVSYLQIVSEKIHTAETIKPSCKGKTCRSNCTFFRADSNNCFIYKGKDYDDPNVASSCFEFTDSVKLEELYQEDNKPNKSALKPSKNRTTCRNNCAYFNDSQDSCIIFEGLDYDDTSIPKSCMEFSNLDSFSNQNWMNEEEEEDDSLNALEKDFLSFLSPNEDTSKYPFEPGVDFSENIEGLTWYVAPDQSFGCWLLNKSLIPVPLYPYQKSMRMKENRYRSLYPLHDHSASENLLNRIAWLVDETGFGQYGVIVYDSIYPISEDNLKGAL